MRKKTIILISIILLTLAFSSCDYFGPGMADFSYDLSGNYLLYHAGETNIWNSSLDKIIIDRNIIGIAWNKDFILAKQTISDKIQYWIIDITTDKTYGPFSEKDFNLKRTELKVGNSLKLEDPAKYK